MDERSNRFTRPSLWRRSELLQYALANYNLEVYAAAYFLVLTCSSPTSAALSTDRGNVIFPPDGNSLLSPVGNRVSVFEVQVAVRCSSLPTSLPDLHTPADTQQENPFQADYYDGSARTPRSHSRPPAQTVDPFPSSDDEEEGEILELRAPLPPLPIAPTVHQTPTPQLVVAGRTHAYSPSPRQSLTGDVDMDAGLTPPTAQSENPHKNLPAFEPSGPDDSLATPHIQTNTGDWRDAVIAYPKLVENLSQSAIDEIERHPELHLLALPFLGSSYFYKTYTAAAADTRTALASVAGTGMMVVAAPNPKDP
ncbi:hypothetical protein GGX14DRAFT_565067 [Mycena pura]|uniref:Uncharacterized protein n=1 Tax=Mycena pura TaxID=153505 RepID=A0AAD6VH04_9AGAR|nr:hypothetical protein GGX14DRAFT_565067 [Mycena pura]